jgi:hypothetical protein
VALGSVDGLGSKVASDDTGGALGAVGDTLAVGLEQAASASATVSASTVGLRMPPPVTASRVLGSV